MSIPTPDEFIRKIHGSGKKDQNGNDKEKNIVVQYGYVDPNYTGGKPAIKFDNNQDVVSTKKYPYIGTLAANDRVMVIDGVVFGPVRLT